MKREDIRTFLKDGADAIDAEFDSGRVTEFNSKAGKTYPFAFVESLSVTTSLQPAAATLIDSWAVVIHIAKLDKVDSSMSQYEAIVDDCDQLARKLIWQYNERLYKTIDATATLSDNTTLKRTAYAKLTISEIQRLPFIKDHADCLTGVILSFTIVSSDNTDVC